jgi:hypothetical protein
MLDAVTMFVQEVEVECSTLQNLNQFEGQPSGASEGDFPLSVGAARIP